MMMQNTDEILPLAEVVHALRREILKIAEALGNDKVRFSVEPIEFEFQVVAKRKGGIFGEIEFGIWSVGTEAGANGRVQSECAQTVRFTLRPLHGRDDATAIDLATLGRGALQTP